MKKILIFSHAMEIGGVEKALLGLLENIDTEHYEVDLFLMRHSGELMRYIPKNIHVLPENHCYSCLAVPIGSVIKRGHFKIAAGRAIGKYKAKKRVSTLKIGSDNAVDLEYSHKYTAHAMPMISEKEYDLAISFLTPHYFVAEKVKAKKKIAWIHTDYSRVAIDQASEEKMWGCYDHIAAISESAANSFLSIFPSLKDKVDVIEHIMPISYIRKLADEKSEAIKEMPDDGSIKVLSVGRFCTAKNFDNVPSICKQILEMGINIKWYLIGFGGDEHLIREKVKECDMEERVIILGKKENPYPYMKQCDIYIQPSRYEGKCVSVIEAQIIGKPVIIAAYATSASQLRDRYDGWIVPQANNECAKQIVKLIADKNEQEKLISHCTNSDYSHSSEIEKVYDYMK